MDPVILAALPVKSKQIVEKSLMGLLVDANHVFVVIESVEGARKSSRLSMKKTNENKIYLCNSWRKG